MSVTKVVRGTFFIILVPGKNIVRGTFFILVSGIIPLLVRHEACIGKFLNIVDRYNVFKLARQVQSSRRDLILILYIGERSKTCAELE